MDTEDVVLILAVALGIAVVGTAILVLRRLWMGPRRSILRDIASYLLMTFVATAAILVFVILAAFTGFLTLVAFVLLIVVSVEGWRKRRATRQYGLLWLLTVSAERSMPLVPAVEAFARESGWFYGRYARAAAAMLRDGMPLPDVLERLPGLVPASAVPMIRVGYEMGSLGQALRQVATSHDIYEPVWMALSGKVAYLLFFLPPFGFGLLIFIMLKIVPSFQKIFADFSTSLPPATQSLISASHFLANYWYLFFPLYAVVAWLFIHVTMRYLGWITWDPPVIARFTRRLDAAQILDTLALVAAGERPIVQGIAALARSYPKQDIRTRLRHSGLDVEGGENWCESLHRQGLLRRPEMAVLQAAERVGNLPWALREMADSVRRRLIYRLQTLAQAAFPPLVVLVGLIVMFIVVSLFLPLVSLIQSLA